MTRHLIAGAVLAAAAVTLAACSAPAPGDDAPTHLSLNGSTGNLINPFTGGILGEYVTQGVYEPLLREIGPGDIIPCLAEDFELSDDQMTLTLTLREDVDFVDGVHLDAQAVADYLDLLFTSDGYISKSVVVDQYESEVTVTGEYTLEIDTIVPMKSEWFHHIAGTAIVSPEAAQDPDSLTTDPVGTGPYLIDELKPDQEVTLVRNPEYRSPETYPYDTITITLYEDEIAALNALKTGQLDVSFIGQFPLAVEAESSGLTVHTGEGIGAFSALFIVDRAGEVQPALADVRVRRAMNMAFDREAINESLNLGFGAITSQPFVEGEEMYVEGGDDRYPYDLERARELMAEAGYADGFDITIPTAAGLTGGFEPIMLQSLSDIGIRVTVDPYPDGEILKLIQEGWPSGRYGVIASPMPYGLIATLYYIEHFFRGYGDPEPERLADIIRTGTPEESAQAATDLGEYILDQAWYVPFSTPPGIVVSQPGIEFPMRLSFGEPALWDIKPAE